MAKIVTNGKISIGYKYLKEVRKKPCICVEINGECFILGTFANEVNAEFFVDKLVELTGAKEQKAR